MYVEHQLQFYHLYHVHGHYFHCPGFACCHSQGHCLQSQGPHFLSQVHCHQYQDHCLQGQDHCYQSLGHCLQYQGHCHHLQAVAHCFESLLLSGISNKETNINNFELSKSNLISTRYIKQEISHDLCKVTVTSKRKICSTKNCQPSYNSIVIDI